MQFNSQCFTLSLYIFKSMTDLKENILEFKGVKKKIVTTQQ